MWSDVAMFAAFLLVFIPAYAWLDDKAGDQRP